MVQQDFNGEFLPDEADRQLAGLRAAVVYYLDNEHEHRYIRERGCRCGYCTEEDPNCGCHALRKAVADGQA